MDECRVRGSVLLLFDAVKLRVTGASSGGGGGNGGEGGGDEGGGGGGGCGDGGEGIFDRDRVVARLVVLGGHTTASSTVIHSLSRSSDSARVGDAVSCVISSSFDGNDGDAARVDDGDGDDDVGGGNGWIIGRPRFLGCTRKERIVSFITAEGSLGSWTLAKVAIVFDCDRDVTRLVMLVGMVYFEHRNYSWSNDKKRGSTQVIA